MHVADINFDLLSVAVLDGRIIGLDPDIMDELSFVCLVSVKSWSGPCCKLSQVRQLLPTPPGLDQVSLVF